MSSHLFKNKVTSKYSLANHTYMSACVCVCVCVCVCACMCVNRI